jgi:hypothetical protein
LPPAVAAAGIVAAGTIGGAVLGARSQRGAARDAANAEVGMQQQNMQLAREFRQQNQANFQPWLNSGNRANSLVDSFLYGPSTAQAVAPATGLLTGQMTEEWANNALNAMGLGSRGDSVATLQAHLRGELEGQLPARLRAAYDNYIQTNPLSAQPSTRPVLATSANGTPTGYDAFVNSTYYQAPLQEGYRALNHGYAANGMLQSGAAMKGITKYGHDYAHSRMGEFIGMAERQSDRGMQGASAIAGVGQNALASQTAANTASGNAMANGHLARGAANANMWAGVGSALGTLGGSLAGPSSYRF